MLPPGFNLLVIDNLNSLTNDKMMVAKPTDGWCNFFKGKFCNTMSYFQLPVYMCGGSVARWNIVNAEEFDEIAKLLRAFARVHAAAACFGGMTLWGELEPFCICTSYGERNP